MKVSFCWNVFTDAEIPEEEVIAAIMNNSGNHLAQGDAFAALARKYNVAPAEDGEITGVFQDWTLDDDGNYIFACSKICDEAIWES